jgi:hypothetical protein
MLANRPQEAVAVLVPLADQYAHDGFAAKAVAVLKRIQKIDPQRRDIASRLAALIEEKQRHATVPIAMAPARVEFGIEEIQPGLELGIEPFDTSTQELSWTPAAPPPKSPVNVPVPEPVPAPVPGPGPESVAAPAPPPPVEDHDLAFGDSAPIELEPEIVVEPEPEPMVLEPVIEPEPSEPVIEVEPEAVPAASSDPLDDLFAQELMAVLEGAFPGGESSAPVPAAAGASPEEEDGGRQIVVSPLFRDFSVDEMVAVIHGLKLLTFEAGEIIISEGEAGESLYMLSAGRVKAFQRNAAGKQALLGEMSEGAFFGEISVLTGKPRTATVVAATACELLELDRATLDEITADHPHVWDVLREYAERRLKGQR